MNNLIKSNSFRNTLVVIGLLIPLTIFAFWKRYFGVLQNPPETVTLRLHLHAMMMCLWLLILFTQVRLIRTKRFVIHRWVGKSSYLIAPLLIWTGLVLVREVLNRDRGEIDVESVRLNIFSFGQLVAFAVTWTLAIVFRKRQAIHRRYMISTAFAVGTAIVFRVFFFWIPVFSTPGSALIATWCVLTILLLGLIVVDWKLGKMYSVYWVVTLLIAAMYIAYWTFTRSDIYISFCQWYAELPPWLFF